MIGKEKIPPRIVLSRKGFDSSAGGCASPVLNKEMISLPIPEHNVSSRGKQDGGLCADGHLTYGDMESSHGKRVGTLVTQLSKGKIKPSDCVHLDPDIRAALRKPNDTKLPLTYGQDSGSQTELRNIEEGDLFLFFGWFRGAEEYRPGYFRFIRDSPDVHAIWGWLQIGARLDLPSNHLRAREIASHHPHVSHPENRNPNCLYVAGETLTFISSFAGEGTFAEYHEDLRLSDLQTELPPRKRLRSRWNLPAFFGNISMTHHCLREWGAKERSIIGKGGAYPGQEFIFETSGYESDVANWLEDIFRGEKRENT